MHNLQPTDTLRKRTIDFYNSLSEEEIKEIPKPQVWNINGRNYISDGNNLSAFLAQKGKKYIEVDFNVPNELSHSCFNLDLLEKDGNTLKNLGIYNPEHLWDL